MAGRGLRAVVRRVVRMGRGKETLGADDAGAAGWDRREVCLEGGNGTNNNYLTC